MTENDTQVPIDLDRLLASILKTLGEVKVPVDAILADYSNYQVYIEQDEENQLIFSLKEITDESG
jgi:hypothetical protein